MISYVRKLSTFLLLVCYIAVSSSAAAHAFPKFDIGSDAPDQSILIVVAEMTGVDCHSPEVPSGESKSSVACKIFCSALAQAITHTQRNLADSSRPCHHASAMNSIVLSRQLAVEPHPPK